MRQAWSAVGFASMIVALAAIGCSKGSDDSRSCDRARANGANGANGASQQPAEIIVPVASPATVACGHDDVGDAEADGASDGGLNETGGGTTAGDAASTCAASCPPNVCPPPIGYSYLATCAIAAAEAGAKTSLATCSYLPYPTDPICE